MERASSHLYEELKEQSLVAYRKREGKTQDKLSSGDSSQKQPPWEVTLPTKCHNG
jgi:hypothetical protein